MSDDINISIRGNVRREKGTDRILFRSLVYDITTKHLTVKWLTCAERRGKYCQLLQFVRLEIHNWNISGLGTPEIVDMTYFPYPIPGDKNPVDVRLTAAKAWGEEGNFRLIWHRVDFSPWVHCGLKLDDRSAMEWYMQTLYVKRSQEVGWSGSLKGLRPNGEDIWEHLGVKWDFDWVTGLGFSIAR
jgi:hypothetical protein